MRFPVGVVACSLAVLTACGGGGPPRRPDAPPALPADAPRPGDAAEVTDSARQVGPVTLTPQSSRVTVRLQAVSAVNPDIVWASGVRGTFMVTRNGGKTWLTGKVVGGDSLEFRDVEGVLIGYRLPEAAAGLNVPGYHFHFLSQDRRGGGHVQEVMVRSAVVDVDISDELTVRLQASPAQPTANAKQLEQETGQVEK